MRGPKNLRSVALGLLAGGAAVMAVPSGAAQAQSFDRCQGLVFSTEEDFVTRAGRPPDGNPIVSDGDHYDRRKIPDHDTRPEFAAPAVSWVPAISPSDLMIYRGTLFRGWRGNAFAAGLSAQAIVRIELDGEQAREAERWPMGARIRSLVEGPGGAIWVLEDERGASRGRLLKLTPR